MDSELYKELISEFYCPVCMGYMGIPIMQCASGHNFCIGCYTKMSVCPQCRESKTSSRNYALERIFQHILLPCKYQRSGCNFTAEGDDIVAHGKMCIFGQIACPLKHNFNCEWRGVFKHMLNHCTDHHSTFVFNGPEQKLMFNGLIFEGTFRHCTMLVLAHNKIFRFTLKIDNTTKVAWFAVYYLGSPAKKDQYSYGIRIFKGDSDFVAIEFQASCVYLVDSSTDFMGDRYLSLYIDKLKHYCHDGDLIYSLKITENFK